jgi:hypothetical protein
MHESTNKNSKYIMNNKIIVISTLSFLFVSFVFLSFIEQKKQDINSQDWWVLYFKDPKSTLLDFTIENHSNANSFRWEIMADGAEAKNGNITIEKGQQKTIPVSATGIENKKITITVKSTENKKEIYKIIASD